VMEGVFPTPNGSVDCYLLQLTKVVIAPAVIYRLKADGMFN